MEVERKNQADLSMAKTGDNAVEEDMDFQIKHPLATSWTFYYLDPDEARKSGWTEANKAVLSFNTVEDFWALYHHTTPLSALKRGSDYSLFRGGLEDMAKIRPEWEDEQNRLGGCWKVAFDGRVGTKIDDIFRELLMMCVGEIFGDYGEFVNGLVASARGKQFRLGIWTKNDDRESCEIIGKKVLDILPSNMNVNMEFVPHKETQKASNARGIEPKAMLTLRKS